MRQSLLISGGDFAVFVSDPIAITIYSVLAIGIAYAAIRRRTKGRPSVMVQARNIPPATGLLELARVKREQRAKRAAGAAPAADAAAAASADSDATLGGAPTDTIEGEQLDEEERAENARRQ